MWLFVAGTHQPTSTLMFCFFIYSITPFPVNKSQSFFDSGFTYSLMKVCSCCLMDLWAWSKRICAHERRETHKHSKISIAGHLSEPAEGRAEAHPPSGQQMATAASSSTLTVSRCHRQRRRYGRAHVQLLPQQIFFPPPFSVCANEGRIFFPPINCEVSVVTRPHLLLFISDFQTAAVWMIIIIFFNVNFPHPLFFQEILIFWAYTSRGLQTYCVCVSVHLYDTLMMWRRRCSRSSSHWLQILWLTLVKKTAQAHRPAPFSSHCLSAVWLPQNDIM